MWKFELMKIGAPVRFYEAHPHLWGNRGNTPDGLTCPRAVADPTINNNNKSDADQR